MKNTMRSSTPSATAVVFALAAAIAVSGAPAEAVVVDEFSTNQATITTPPGGASTATTAGADIVGLKRGLTAKLRRGAGPMTTGVAGGKLTMAVPNTTPDSRGEAVVTWDADNLPTTLTPTGLAGVDVTTSNHTAFAFTVTSATAGSELVLEVYTNGGNASRGFLRLPAVVASTVFYLSYKSDFVPFRGAGASFANVGAIVLTVRGTEATVDIEKIETVAAVLAVSKTDLTLGDVEIGATQQPPGTTFKYRVTITNTGGEALQVDLNDTIDANTTLTAATVKAGIAAINDSYETPGNVKKTVAAAEGLLANDVDPDQNGGPPELTVNTAGSPFATTLGGSMALASDGSFVYTPPTGVGFAVDTLTYTVNDNDGASATATAKIYLKRTVWFVDDNADVSGGPDGTGTFDDPFDALAQVSGAGTGPDGIDDLIFVHAGTYAAGVVLDAGQDLIGEGSGLQVDLDSIVVAGTAPTINSASNGITLNVGNTLAGFTVGNTPAASFDITGTNFGTLTVSNVTLNGTGGALDLTTGALAAVFNSVSSTSSNRAIRLNAATGSLDTGSTTISGATVEAIEVTNGGSTYDFGPVSITTSAAGIDLGTSATSTFIFDSLSVTTTSGFALRAASAGTLNIAGATNVLNATGGEAIDLTSTSLGTGATFSNVTSSGSPGKGINLDGVTGAFSATGGSIGTATGIAVDINAGTGAISYTGGITNAAARAVEITGRTTSTVTLLGNISDSGTGVNIASNSGGTITLSGTYSGTAVTSQIDVASNSGSAVVNFSGSSKVLSTGASNAIDVTTNGAAQVNFTGGGLVVTTTSGVGLNATGGGNISVQGSGNTLVSTTGTALNVTSTAITGAGLTFEKISSNGGGNVGIVLTNTCGGAVTCATTPSAGGLTVTGNGGSCTSAVSCTGGAIQNKTGSVDGISLDNTRAISLSNMFIDNNGGDGIFGDELTSFSLTSSMVTNNDASNGVGGGAPTGLRFEELYGANTITNCSITDNHYNNIEWTPSSGTSTLSIMSSTIGPNDGAAGNNGILLLVDGSATTTIDVSSTTFNNNRASQFQVSQTGSGLVTANVTGCDFYDGNIDVDLGHSQSGDLNFNIDGNDMVGADSNVINFSAAATSTNAGDVNGKINNNRIGCHAANDPLPSPACTGSTADSGSRDAFGIGIDAIGDVDMVLSITNNRTRHTDFEGIFAESAFDDVDLDGETALFDLTLTGNDVGQPDDNSAFPFGVMYGVRIEARHTSTLCLDIADNNAASVGGVEHFRVRQRNTATFNMERLTDGDGTPNEVITNMPTVEAFVAGGNDPGSTVDATNQTAGVTGFTERANGFCRNPSN